MEPRGTLGHDIHENANLKVGVFIGCRLSLSLITHTIMNFMQSALFASGALDDWCTSQECVPRWTCWRGEVILNSGVILLNGAAGIEANNDKKLP